ncbi:transposon Tn917 resolvase [Lysinibacillus sphaericus]|uniref:recombinase family protein n=1 Tax=Lysinibacillus TaxID=400634 RepID=UPI00084B1B61|nr:recombinase family protein [Lysinibacillus sphaericus]OEC02067.1 transposon Tn917 resolvase [Lysinibacillus sphaericus]
MSRVIGYGRVSTHEQNLDMQYQAIEQYALEKGMSLVFFSEKISSRKDKRIELQNALKAAVEDDIFVVYKLYRLARSTKELYELTELFQKKGIHFVSLSDSFDTTTPTGKAMFGMLAVFAEFERDIIQQRTKAGLEAARKRGRIGGRPKIEEVTKRRVVALFESGESAIDIAKAYGISRATVYNIINDENRA